MQKFKFFFFFKKKSPEIEEDFCVESFDKFILNS
jgi:hypothetical protein